MPVIEPVQLNGVWLLRGTGLLLASDEVTNNGADYLLDDDGDIDRAPDAQGRLAVGTDGLGDADELHMRGHQARTRRPARDLGPQHTHHDRGRRPVQPVRWQHRADLDQSALTPQPEPCCANEDTNPSRVRLGHPGPASSHAIRSTERTRTCGSAGRSASFEATDTTGCRTAPTATAASTAAADDADTRTTAAVPSCPPEPGCRHPPWKRPPSDQPPRVLGMTVPLVARRTDAAIGARETVPADMSRSRATQAPGSQDRGLGLPRQPLTEHDARELIAGIEAALNQVPVTAMEIDLAGGRRSRRDRELAETPADPWQRTSGSLDVEGSPGHGVLAACPYGGC